MHLKTVTVYQGNNLNKYNQFYNTVPTLWTGVHKTFRPYFREELKIVYRYSVLWQPIKGRLLLVYSNWPPFFTKSSLLTTSMCFAYSVINTTKWGNRVFYLRCWFIPNPNGQMSKCSHVPSFMSRSACIPLYLLL